MSSRPSRRRTGAWPGGRAAPAPRAPAAPPGAPRGWADQAVDDIEAIARFRDSVAVELPVDPDRPTSVMMGQIGRPVHILHWRASWQSEMESGSRSVQRAFPNAVNEVTPEAVLGEEASRGYHPALY